jgi:hypothetical protein
MIRVTLDEENLRIAEKFVKSGYKIVNRSMYAAIGRALTTSRKAIKPILNQKYTVKQGGINHVVNLKKERTDSFLKGTLEVTGKMIPLSYFNFKVPRKRSGMVRVSVKKRNSPKPVKGLFANRTRRGKRISLRRKQKTRYPLSVAYGPSVPKMVESEEVLRPIVSVAEKTLNERFLHEISWRLSKK